MDFLINAIILVPLAAICYFFGLMFNSIQIKKGRDFMEAFLRSSLTIIVLFSVVAIPFFLAIIFTAELAPMQTGTYYQRTEYIHAGILTTLGLFPFVAVPFYTALYQRYRKSAPST